MNDIDPDYQELRGLFQILVEDVAQIAEYRQGSDSQAMRRALVRAFFALVEGTTWRLKALVLDRYPTATHLTPAHLALLREESYHLSDKGEPQTRPRFPGILENLCFAFHTAARATNADWQLDTASRGWQALQEALKVRHRITHPKDVGSCEVSEADMKVVNAALAWFIDTLESFVAAPSKE